MMPNVKEISLISISLLMFASLFQMLLQSIVYSVFITFVVFPHWDALEFYYTNQCVKSIHFYKRASL